jgi:hypothetical protein
VSEISIIWAATSLVFNTVLTGAMVVKLLSVALSVLVCMRLTDTGWLGVSGNETCMIG